MNEKEKEYLKKFYYLLRDNLLREKSLKASSVLVSFLETRSASRYKLLSNSTISSGKVPSEILASLLNEKEVQAVGNIGEYAITAKGVWEYEQDLGLMNEKVFLTYLNEKYFSDKYPRQNIRSGLDDREAVILLAMIAARTFSEKSSVDLKKDDVVKGKWQDVLGKSYDLLYNLQTITKLKKEDFLGKTGNINIVSSIFRHNTQMVQKTRGIYSYTGRQEYYLNLYKNETISKDELSYLFWKIFKGEVSLESVDSIIEYCNSVSSKENIYLFNMEEHIFSMPNYDSLLKDSLLDSIKSKTKWAKSS